MIHAAPIYPLLSVIKTTEIGRREINPLLEKIT